MVKEGGLKRLLLIAFALSGMTALIYEVVWTRPLQLIFGSTIYAVSTMLTTFMFGFALGSYTFRNLADRVKNPALLFAGLELGIGLYGLIVLSLFAILPSIYLSLLEVPGFQFLQFLLSFAVLIIPATLFGATWPAINKAYTQLSELGKDAGLLYSFNSLGAMAGSIAAGFLLIPAFGIRMSALLTASLNIFVAIIVFIYVRKNNEEK
ncbi:MFS transporter [Candidatus Woesearchaeota archaeon]|nr:MFS transporter [Candidatus Woesearchaeota archaeon]